MTFEWSTAIKKR